MFSIRPKSRLLVATFPPICIGWLFVIRWLNLMSAVRLPDFCVVIFPSIASLSSMPLTLPLNVSPSFCANLPMAAFALGAHPCSTCSIPLDVKFKFLARKLRLKSLISGRPVRRPCKVPLMPQFLSLNFRISTTKSLIGPSTLQS